MALRITSRWVLGVSIATLALAPAIAPAGRAPFDPVRDNGPIFVGWPRPRLAIVITGRQDGYLEPCGCAGLDRMRGGLSRRETMIEALRARGWALALVDAGGFAARPGAQALLKFRHSIDALVDMGYDAIGFGTAELRFPGAELLSVVAPGDDGRSGRFVSANVGLFGAPGEIAPRTRIVRAGGVRLGVTSVLGDGYAGEIHNPDVRLEPAIAGLERVVGRLRSGCEVMLLLAHAPREESLALARRFPQFDVVVSADGPPVSPAEPTRVDGSGRAVLVEVGTRGKDAVVLGWFDAPGDGIRYQRVPIDSRFAPSTRGEVRMAEYQDELRQLGFEGLGVRPMAHPGASTRGTFVGSDQCRDCHRAEHDVWGGSGHARATRTLVGLDPSRQFDPECVACHVTGWHPGAYVPYEGGYASLSATPHLAGVGCENCHGPCGAHATAERASASSAGGAAPGARVARPGRVEPVRLLCGRCHDASNSPEFSFDAYWPEIAHGANE